MLNYLGSGIGPGTMPAAVPGASQTGDTLGTIRGRAPMPPQMADAIRPAAPSSGLGVPGLMPSMPPGPADIQYEAVTQQDGTVLLHIKNPDGSLGPAVKIINAVKPQKGE